MHAIRLGLAVCVVASCAIAAYGCGTNIADDVVSSGDDDAGQDATIGTADGAAGADATTTGDGGGPSDAGVIDGEAGDDSGGSAIDSSATDSGPADSGADGGGDAGTCTPIPDAAAMSACGVSCDLASQFCVYGSVVNKCVSLAPQCRCAETHSCACEMATTGNPCDAGTAACTQLDSGAIQLVITGAGANPMCQ